MGLIVQSLLFHIKCTFGCGSAESDQTSLSDSALALHKRWLNLYVVVGKHSKEYTLYTLGVNCSFALAITIKP